MQKLFQTLDYLISSTTFLYQNTQANVHHQKVRREKRITQIQTDSLAWRGFHPDGSGAGGLTAASVPPSP